MALRFVVEISDSDLAHYRRLLEESVKDGRSRRCGAEQEALRGKETDVTRKQWPAAKRRQMFLRIKRRRNELRRHGSRASPTPALLAYRA